MNTVLLISSGDFFSPATLPVQHLHAEVSHP